MLLCTIFGGTNGAGKSTLYEALRPAGEFVNADVVARSLNPSDPARASMAAGRHVLRRLEELMRLRQDFVYETTLSSRQAIELMRRAGAAGYEVGLVFVFLRHADLNVRRVAQRVAAGGHAIPEPVVRRRYGVSFDRLRLALPLSVRCDVYDNSLEEADLVASIKGGACSMSGWTAPSRHTGGSTAPFRMVSFSARRRVRRNRFFVADTAPPSTDAVLVEERSMTKRGRPRGTGFDDGAAIDRVLTLMAVHGLTRRAAIIAACGIDQLRRIERKMAAAVAWRDVMGIGKKKALVAGVEDPRGKRFSETCDAIAEHGCSHVFGENIHEGAKAMGILLFFPFQLRGDDPGIRRMNTLNPFADDLSAVMASFSA